MAASKLRSNARFASALGDISLPSATLLLYLSSLRDNTPARDAERNRVFGASSAKEHEESGLLRFVTLRAC